MSFFNFDDEPKISIQDLVSRYENSVRKNEYLLMDEESLERLAEFYEFEGNYEYAMEVVELGLKQHPFSAILMLKKAQLLFDIKKCEESLIWVERALLYDPSDQTILLLKAEVFTFLSRYNEALKILHDLEEKGDKEILGDVYLHMADVYEDWEKYDKVFDVLTKCLKSNPNNEEALSRINYCTEITERFEESMNLHEKILDEEPYSFSAWYNLASAFGGLELYEKAIDAIDFVIAIDEDLEYAYRDKAEYLYIIEEYKKALEAIKEYQRLTSGTEESFILEGDCHLALGEVKHARYCYRKAISQNPSFHRASYKIGITHSLENEWVLALKAFERAIEIWKEDFSYWREICIVRMHLEDYEGVFEAANKMIELKPREEYGYFLLAKGLYIEGVIEEAFKVLDYGIEKCKEPIKLNYAKAAILFLTQKNKEGEIMLTELLNSAFNNHFDLFEFDESLKENEKIKAITSLFNSN